MDTEIAKVEIYRNGVLIETLTNASVFGDYRGKLNETTLGAVAYTAVATTKASVSASASVCPIFYPEEEKSPPSRASGIKSKFTPTPTDKSEGEKAASSRDGEK